MRNFRRINYTKEGLEQLKDDYSKLLAERPAAVKELVRAREMGDLSENGLYRAAKSRLISIDASLRRISMNIKLAEVSEPTKGLVGIGSKVLLSDGDNEFSYTIVGPHEADPVNKKISQNSPIGRALIGKKTNDSVSIRTPKNVLNFKIVSVN